jgi:DNA recombination protein RmuC
METGVIILLVLIPAVGAGAAIGATICHFIWKAKSAKLEAEHAADLDKIEWVKDSQHALRETFEALAAKALRHNAADFSGRVNQNLVAHAGSIGTLKTSLESSIAKIDGHIRELERKREAAYQGLSQNVANLQRAYTELRDTTAQLVNALKAGPVRGRWGEIQLRKIVELAGLNEHVSFLEQAIGADGRPDLLVHLPNQGQITVDAKFPLNAFLEAMAALDDQSRRGKLLEHTRTLRQKIKELAGRGYWEQFQPSPELVIMFIPIESCLMAAYECDPEIIEFALGQKVILASPITLLGFMKSIAYGWQQFTISKNAKVILEQGKELHKRAAKWLDHFRTTGVKLGAVVDAYNASVSSLQTRFFPAARRFQELTAIADELKDMPPVTKGLTLAPTCEEVPNGHAEPLPAIESTTEVSKGWFLTRDGRRKEGPFSLVDLKKLVGKGELQLSAMVLADGDQKWVSVESVFGTQPAADG